jgi:hypothetical protein
LAAFSTAFCRWCWNGPRLRCEAFPRWWELIGSAGLISLFTVIFNANLPVTARELMKSASMGFAICATLKIFGILG